MSSERLVRVNALLKRALAESLFRVMSGGDFDLAAVSVTRVDVSSDLHQARVLVSILGHEQDRGRLLDQLRRHRAEFQQILSREVILKYTPQLHFHLDDSIKEGDRMLQLLEDMEKNGGQTTDDGGQKAGDGEQRTDDGEQMTEAGDENPKSDL